ncbi:hypothetical protein [Pseudotabrizicola alkalilacus]|uniref:Uncharacterized protein n=1 Tax=Pseudotabrizicola alkalilacus TaxID=2305252 RepID=A0A411Z3Q9_9RHOB|nr:hypothetical protein [Pseudotabrizicola alkalilacus]RGP37699.1 hypothetical protein D1012_07215 [Pseudotabrizicola alkalilacus]
MSVEPAYKRTLGKYPEQDLWQSVLLVVVQEALYGGLNNGCRIEQEITTRRARACQSARDYLTTPSLDLSMVCAMAGLDMQAVIDNMTRQIAAAPSPEELAASDAPRVTRTKKTRKTEPKSRAPRDRKRHTYDGESLTLKEWSVRTGLAEGTLRSRLFAHWPIERALTEPSGQQARRPRKEQPRPAKAGKPGITLTHAGETMTLKQWAARLGLSKPTINKRLRMGLPIDQVLSSQNMRGKSFAGR